MLKKINVIIPTFNRSEILAKTLRGLTDQTLSSDQFEVTVIDDNSSDNTREVVHEFISETSLTIKYIHAKKSNASAVRNMGIKNSHSDLLLFIDDDIKPSRFLIEEHKNWHDKFPGNNFAISGKVDRIPEEGIFENFLVKGNSVFKNGHGVKTIHWKNLWSNNVSFKREFLLGNGLFNEALPRYQDTELAYRLHKKGLVLLYNEKAVGYHSVPIKTAESYLKRAEVYGKALAFWSYENPNLKKDLVQQKVAYDFELFSWSNPLLRIVKDFIRMFTLNKISINPLLFTAKKFEKRRRNLSLLLYKQAYIYYHRMGFKNTAKLLKNKHPFKS